MKVRKWLGVAAGAALALAVLVPRGAVALTLDDLDTGGSFSVGPLTFENFDVAVAGDLSGDLDDYLVQVIGDGFRISGGPLSALLGDSGTMTISYEVSALAPIINGASLLAPGETIGAGAQAWVAETLLGPGAVLLDTLFAFDVEGVGADADDDTGFAPVAGVSVTKVIHVSGGLFALLPYVEQHFFAVPEPVSLLLLAGGLAGLALAGRRRELLA